MERDSAIVDEDSPQLITDGLQVLEAEKQKENDIKKYEPKKRKKRTKNKS